MATTAADSPPTEARFRRLRSWNVILGFLHALHAFGHRAQLEGLGQRDKIADEDLVLPASRDVAHEGSVYLDDIDGQRLEMTEGRETGPEVIQRDLAAELAHRAHEARRFLDIMQRRGLRNLDHQPP